MQILQLALAVNILFMVDKFFNRVPPVAKAQRFPFEQPFVGLATGTLTSTILEKLLHIDTQEKAKCALSINNQLTSFRLTDPLLYLGHGENPMPVPLKIETNSTIEMIFEAAGEGKDTAGLLFYKIETTGHYLRVFWKISGPSKGSTYTPNRLDVKIVKPQEFTDNEKSLDTMYGDIKATSEEMTEEGDFMVTETLLAISGRSRVTNPLKITTRSQMTTEKDGKLTVAISDNLSPPVTQLQRRAVTATLVGTSLMSTVLGVMFKKVMKHIPKEQTGTISLENKSKEMLLINPSWFIMGGHTSSIVPWDIKPTEKGTITWRSPLAGISVLETFTYTVHFVSYQIEGTNYHVVAGTWFPLKLGKGQSAFTLFVIEKKVEAQTMKNILSIVGKGLAEKTGDANQLVSYIKSNRQNQFILDSIPDKNIYGLRSSKYQRYYEWQYPILTPQVRAKPGEKYHVKIVAAVGFGKALGAEIKVEVLPGESPQAASFKKQNPQNYLEPPSGTSQATGTAKMVSDLPGTAMPTNQIQPNLQSANGSSPAAAENTSLTTSGSNGMLQMPVTLPNEIPAEENWPTATAALGTNAILRSTASKSATAKKISAKIKKSGKRSFGRTLLRRGAAARRLGLTRKRKRTERKIRRRYRKMILERQHQI